YSAMLVIQKDVPGVLAHITHCLSESKVNIAFMRLFREAKGDTAYTFVESDNPIPPNVTPAVQLNPNVFEVMLIDAI
ncbi:MAG: L-serine ammonia-lyase, iron-sulfur-dependent, subunit beta, partial [Bacillota bacterium]|nr:L-serine ammonia-lyase, iron-sulfur-dependent, subunit beta [Bacillota bacterium]